MLFHIRWRMQMLLRVAPVPAVVIAVLCVPVSAEVEPRFHVGSLEIHPYSSFNQKYDSNIYLSPRNNEIDDFISNLKVGVGLDMPLIPQRGKDFMIKASYDAGFIKYWDNNSLDRVDHTASMSLVSAFKNNITVSIKDHFKITAEPPNMERTDIQKRYRNVLDASIIYRRQKMAIEGIYQLLRDDYKNLNSFDKTHNLFGTIFSFRVLPKTSVLAEADVELITYDSHATNSDSIAYQWLAGVEGEVLPKVTGIVKSGYRIVEYEESQKDDFAGVAVSAGLEYDPTERTELTLLADRTSRESTYKNNSHYTANALKFNLTHDLLARLTFDGNSFVQLNAYPEETTEADVVGKRRDLLWGLGAGLLYQIKEWLAVDVAYKFKQRDSRFDNFDYNDHIVSSTVSCKF